MGTRSFLRVKWPGRSVIYLFHLWAFVACSRVNSTFTPRCLKILPSVRRTDSSPKEPTTNCRVLYDWGPGTMGSPAPRALQGPYIRHCSRYNLPLAECIQWQIYVLVSESHERGIWSVTNRTTHCTNLYDVDVCPRLRPLDNKRWTGDLSMYDRVEIIQEGTLK
jgi:hypothetical protein